MYPVERRTDAVALRDDAGLLHMLRNGDLGDVIVFSKLEHGWSSSSDLCVVRRHKHLPSKRCRHQRR